MNERIEQHNAAMDREFDRACAAAAYRLPQEYTATVKIEVSATVLVRRGRWGWDTDVGERAAQIGLETVRVIEAAAVKAAEEADK